jgi:TPR repeat protein
MKLMQVVLMASTFSFLATNGVIPAIPLSNELQVVVNAGNQVPQFDLEAGGNHVAILAAMFDFGVAYDFGRGVAQDDEGAVRWYRMAANQ